MEYEVEYNVPGSIPECGAIFMSNVSTKRECFRRKLLGLPFAQVNFVKQIKAGMVLFLFEFERRELYGVFRACSDGSTNIVPHAFTSSGKQFPAQVRFTPIWYCNPLSEHEFQDAIEENYFSKKKFNFGLSENQVRRLLCLFSSRKLPKPQRLFSRQASKSIGKERSLAGDDDYFLRNKAEKFVEEDSLVSGIDAKHPGNYSSNNGRRLDGNSFMMSDGIKNDHNVNSCQGYDIFEPPSGSLGKRRKDDDDRFLMQDSIAYDHYSDHDLARVIHIDHPGDLSDKSGRVAEESKFSLTKCIMGSNTGPIATPKYFWESLAKVGRATDNSRFPTGDNLGDKYTPEHGIRLVTSTDSHENIAIKARRASDDHGFFMDYRVENDSDFENYPEPVISTDRRVNTLDRLRTIDRGMFIGNDRTEIEQYVDNGSCEVRKESDDGIFSMSDRVDVPSEYFANRTDYASRLNDHDRFLARMSMENAHNIKSSHPLDKLSRVSDECIFEKTDRLENAYNRQYSFRLQNSPASTNLCQSRQNPPFFSSDPTLETKSLFCQDQTKLRSPFSPSMEWKNCDSSCSTSHDAIMVTGTVPYDPELPGIHRRNQSSFTVDCSSRPALDFPLHHNSNGNPFADSFNRPSPYRSEAEYLSKQLDISSGFGNKVPLHTTSPNSYTHSGLQTSSSLLSAEYHGKIEAKVTGQELYKGLLFPESASASPPYSRNDMRERQNTSPFIDFDKHALTSQGRYEHTNLHHENSEGFRVYDASFSSDKGHLHSESSHEKSNNRGMEYTYQNAKGVPTDSKSKRTSVFARLSSASEVNVQENDHDNFCSAEEESNYDFQFDECDLGASVDQVMNTLYESLDHRIMKARKSSVRKHVMECDKMKMPPLKIENVSEHIIEENCDEIAEETRVVSFKRRSETKKNKDGAKEKTSVSTLEHEREDSVQKSVREGLEGKQHKRRKLTRPVFGKKEHLNEGLSSDGHPNLQLSSSQGSNKDGTGRLDDSVKSRDNEKCLSPNTMLVQVASLSGCEGTSVNIKQSSYRGGKKSVNYDRKESFDGAIKRASTSNLQVSSHEGFNAKENTGSCDGLARSHESENISLDVGFVHAINPTICEAGNTVQTAKKEML